MADAGGVDAGREGVLVTPPAFADIDGGGIGRDLPADADRAAVQRHAALGVDTALDRDRAVRRDRNVVGSQPRRHRLVDDAVGADHLLEEVARRRVDRELSGVDHSGRPDREAGGVREIDVPADLAVLVGIQDAVDDDRAVADDIDERAGILRQVHVDGRAARLFEARERVVAGIAGHRLGGDRRGRAADGDIGLCPPVGRDHVLREGRSVPQHQRHGLADQATLAQIRQHGLSRHGPGPGRRRRRREHDVRQPRRSGATACGLGA